MRKSWLIGMLVVGTLSGCGLKAPGASGEGAVRTSKTRYAPAPKVTPKPIADAGTPNEVAARPVVAATSNEAEDAVPSPRPSSTASDVPVVTLAPLPVAPTTATATVAAPTPSPSPTPAPYLSVLTTPVGNYRAVPVTMPDGEVLEIRFQPKLAQAVWQLQVMDGQLLISKVKIAMRPDGDGATLQMEVAPGELKWPSVMSGVQDLSLPLNVAALAHLLQTQPDTTGYTVEVSLLDAAGRPLTGQDQEPVVLSLAVEVL